MNRERRYPSNNYCILDVYQMMRESIPSQDDGRSSLYFIQVHCCVRKLKGD